MNSVPHRAAVRRLPAHRAPFARDDLLDAGVLELCVDLRLRLAQLRLGLVDGHQVLGQRTLDRLPRFGYAKSDSASCFVLFDIADPIANAVPESHKPRFTGGPAVLWEY